MSAITKEFTKEQLQQIIETDHVQCGESSALARIALESLEAEVVGYVDAEYAELLKSGHIESCSLYAEQGEGYIALYDAPPAPVSVPEPIKRNDADGWWMYKGRRVGGGCAEWYNRALDDCRAAMLQGAENAESRCTIQTAPALDSSPKKCRVALQQLSGDSGWLDGKRRSKCSTDNARSHRNSRLGG
ncbi:Uncharacterised protein [Enterobacter cancerogenus]|uniref:Uncharacterized protein n=1 Tax=Enterobacter cancerogenus TaxID=69218 RepID=A0A484Z8K6_9ENTR|nr:Uncharacterised protein [Enterobacter cancerogenus]